MFKRFLLFASIFLSFDVFCVDILSNVQEELKESLEEHIEKVRQNKCGKILLERISDLYNLATSKYNRGNIIFEKSSSKMSFFPRITERKIDLVIGILNFDKSSYPCLHKISDEYAAVYSEPTEFWVTLSHELIHLKHKLEEINEVSKVSFEGATNIADIPYSKALNINIRDVIIEKRYDISLFPELMPLRLNMSELWPNLEERRAVIGPDKDGVCENSIREAANLPLRFIYQKESIRHLEKLSELSNIIHNANLPASKITLKDCVNLDEEISLLTPLDILLNNNISEEQIKNVDITNTTKEIFECCLKKEIEDYRIKDILSILVSKTNTSAILSWDEL